MRPRAVPGNDKSSPSASHDGPQIPVTSDLQLSMSSPAAVRPQAPTATASAI